MRILAPLLITVTIVVIAMLVVMLQKRYVMGPGTDSPAPDATDGSESATAAPRSAGEVHG